MKKRVGSRFLLLPDDGIAVGATVECGVLSLASPLLARDGGADRPQADVDVGLVVVGVEDRLGWLLSLQESFFVEGIDLPVSRECPVKLLGVRPEVVDDVTDGLHGEVVRDLPPCDLPVGESLLIETVDVAVLMLFVSHR